MSAISIIEAEEPVAPAPEAVAEALPAPAAEQPSRFNRMLPAAAASLAALAGFLSVVGLTIASRTVANASLVVADARERQVQLARVEALIEEVDALRVREEAALDRMARPRSVAPVTSADVHRAMDDLKLDLAKHEPEEGTLGLVRSGQSELAERIGQISLKLDRVEQKLSANRRATPAGGRAPTS